jgi:glycosyltransferase involved in cell wall biosynthesis
VNIWILTSEYPPEGGGIGSYVYSAARMLAAGGHAVTVLKLGINAAETMTGDGVRLIEFATKYPLRQAEVPPDTQPDEHPAFPYNVMSYWPALSFQFAAEFSRRVEQLGIPDLVEVQDYGAIGYYFIVRRLLGESPFDRVPVVVHLHSPVFVLQRVNRLPRYKLPQYWVGQMEKFCIRAADGIVSPSRYLADRVQTEVEGLPTATVIPHPYQTQSSVQSGLSRGDVVYFGRVDYLKGVFHLLDGCVRLWVAGQDFTLTLIGGDSELAGMESSAKERIRQQYAKFITAGNLIICDPLPTARLLERVARAWCVVIPSLFENFPNTCIEAMALGKLVLASTSGGQAEMIGEAEQAGLLFDWDTPDDFEQKLGRVLAMPAAEVERLGQNAAQRISRLTDFAEVLPHTIDYFEAVIGQSKASRNHYPSAQPGIPAADDTDSQPGLLSVVVPFYNLGRYLPETVDSILAATYAPCEVIIVNDGSTDPDSLRVLADIEARHRAAIRVISIENAGLANARNVGANAARGEFLAFVDADDTVEPGYFEKAIGVLQQYNNVSFVYSWLRFFGKTTGCWVTYNAEFPFLLGHNMVSILAVLRRQHFLKYGQNRPQLENNFEDYDSWISLTAAGCVGVSLPEMLANYRVRTDSRYQSAHYDELLTMYDIMTHHHESVYRRHAVDLVNLIAANGTPLVWDHPGADWNAPLVQLETLSHRYRVELQSQDFVTRHFVRLTVDNLKKALKHPGKAWQKFLKWYRIYFTNKPL